jgi:hypothetical protein
MDSLVISPGPGPRKAYDHPRWYVRKGLDDRIEGQRELLELKNRPVILPGDVRLKPKPEALDRRMDLLAEAC